MGFTVVSHGRPHKKSQILSPRNTSQALTTTCSSPSEMPCTMTIATDGVSDVLMKVVVFAVVQALVYLILTKSSNVFSANQKLRSLSFRPARSVSVRRLLALLSDMPPGGETSPSSSSRSLADDSSWTDRKG
ncbi:hypothetical protein BHM03_00049623 [Ensete ventricosum]|nr:hypothetical protein BHM03_00049623 [Ensete ventricosum]